MIFGVVIELAVGALCAGLGLLLWKKRMLSLLHDYHYQHVKQEDIPAYTRLMGIGLITVGAGIAGTAALNLLRSRLWWVPLTAGIVLGLAIIVRAQKKYNGSIMT